MKKQEATIGVVTAIDATTHEASIRCYGRPYPYKGIDISRCTGLYVGSRVWVGFYEKNRNLPFVLERSKMSLHIGSIVVPITYTGIWTHYLCSMLSNCYVSPVAVLTMAVQTAVTVAYTPGKLVYTIPQRTYDTLGNYGDDTGNAAYVSLAVAGIREAKGSDDKTYLLYSDGYRVYMLDAAGALKWSHVVTGVQTDGTVDGDPITYAVLHDVVITDTKIVLLITKVTGTFHESFWYNSEGMGVEVEYPDWIDHESVEHYVYVLTLAGAFVGEIGIGNEIFRDYGWFGIPAHYVYQWWQCIDWNGDGTIEANEYEAGHEGDPDYLHNVVPATGYEICDSWPAAMPYEKGSILYSAVNTSWPDWVDSQLNTYNEGDPINLVFVRERMWVDDLVEHEVLHSFTSRSWFSHMAYRKEGEDEVAYLSYIGKNNDTVETWAEDDNPTTGPLQRHRSIQVNVSALEQGSAGIDLSDLLTAQKLWSNYGDYPYGSSSSVLPPDPLLWPWNGSAATPYGLVCFPCVPTTDYNFRILNSATLTSALYDGTLYRHGKPFSIDGAEYMWGHVLVGAAWHLTILSVSSACVITESETWRSSLTDCTIRVIWTDEDGDACCLFTTGSDWGLYTWNPTDGLTRPFYSALGVTILRAYCDGTYIYLLDTSYVLRRYNVSDGSQVDSCAAVGGSGYHVPILGHKSFAWLKADANTSLITIQEMT